MQIFCTLPPAAELRGWKCYGISGTRVSNVYPRVLENVRLISDNLARIFVWEYAKYIVVTRKVYISLKQLHYARVIFDIPTSVRTPLYPQVLTSFMCILV